MAKYSGQPNEPEWELKFPGYGQQCTAEARKGSPDEDARRCRNPARRHMEVCRYHGARPDLIAKRAVKESVTSRLAELGLSSTLRESAEWDKHPIEHLLEELARSSILVQLYGQEIERELGSDADASLIGRWYGEHGVAREDARAIVQLYEGERERHARLAKMCLDAGVAERTVRLREEQAQGIAYAVRGILAELEVLHLPGTPAVVRKHLSKLSAGGQVETVELEAGE